MYPGRSYSPVRRRGVPGRSAARRKSLWNVATGNNASLASGALLTPVDVLSGLEAQGVGIVGGTIARTHVRIMALAAAADTAPGYAYGLVVTDSTLSKPDPSSDFFISWLDVDLVDPSNMGPVVSASATRFTQIRDVRARRRLDEMNDKYFLVLKNTGTASLAITWWIRTLVLLP
jgi:hypothetical protein